ncbi:unnamed protein product [Effrenium voratum]|nr:unnamed protein product [Effrenium voratum]
MNCSDLQLLLHTCLVQCRHHRQSEGCLLAGLGYGLCFWTRYAVSKESIHPDAMAAYRIRAPYEPEGVHHTGSLAGSCIGYEKMVAKRDYFRERFYKAWQAANLDIVICPASATPALHVEEVRHAVFNVGTTRVFNYLDMPAGVVTVTSVTASDLALSYDPACENREINRMAMRAVQDSEGLPIAVQLVALPWREELCLRAMLELEEACKFQGNHRSLQPEPRRSPILGAAPECFGQSRL